MLWCILDSGVDASHRDLAQALLSGCSEAQGCLPWAQDLSSHGTHVAGTIGAARNQQGVVGLAAERARIYMYNIFGASSFFDESDLVPAWEACLSELDYLKATVNPAMRAVVSMSIGGVLADMRVD